MNKNFLILNFIILILFFYYLKNNINLNDLSEILKIIKIKDIIIIFGLFLLRPILTTLRWFILLKNFTQINFLDFFRNIIMGSSLNLITSSSIAIEFVKLAKIQKDLGLNKGIFLIVLDKAYALIFKIIFIMIILNLFNIFVFKEYIFETLIISVLLTLVIYFFRFQFFGSLNKIIQKKFHIKISEFLKVLTTCNKSFLSIFFINLVTQILNIYLYFIIFSVYGGELSLFEISIFVTLIDFVSQMQFMIIGLKEFSTVYFSKYIYLSNEIALTGAIAHRLFDVISVIFLFLIFNLLFTNSKKNN